MDNNINNSNNTNNKNENADNFRDINDINDINNKNDANDINDIKGFADSDEFNDMKNFALNGGADASAPAAARSSGENPDAKPADKNKFKINDYSISGFIRAIRDYWRNISRKTKITVISSTAFAILCIVIAVVVLNIGSYVTTYTGLDDREAGEIMSILNTYNVKYRWDNTLKTVSLKEKDQATAVAALAMEGYPRIGRVVYEASSGGGLFDTKEDKQRRYNQDLENKLGATINTMNGIDSAIVTLSLPDNSRNILTQDQQPSKASILLHIKPGYAISRETVQSIENLIEKSVDNLNADNISISDSSGKMLNNYSDDTSMMTLVEVKKNYQLEQERYINQKVEELFGALFGIDGMRVASTVTADFNKLIEEAKNYLGINVDENGEQSGLVVGKAMDRTVSSSNDSNAMGAAGTDLNIDEDGYYEALVDDEDGAYMDDYHFTEERVVNYVISQMERTAPEITDVSLTVFLDYDIIEEKFIDYDEDNMIRALANATGINAVAMKNLPADTLLDSDYYSNYISIVALPFPKPEEPEERIPIEDIFGLTPFQVLVAVGAGLIVMIVIVTIIIIAANNKNRRRVEPEEYDKYDRQAVLVGEGGDLDLNAFGIAAARHAAEYEYETPQNADDDITPIKAKEQMLKRQIKMFTDQNPEIAAQLIRTLMTAKKQGGGT